MRTETYRQEKVMRDKELYQNESKDQAYYIFGRGCNANSLALCFQLQRGYEISIMYRLFASRSFDVIEGKDTIVIQFITHVITLTGQDLFMLYNALHSHDIGLIREQHTKPDKLQKDEPLIENIEILER